MSFETITQAQMHRAALAVGVRALLAEERGGFEGDAREGSIYFEADDHVSIRAAWCAEGVVAVAFDNYAQDEVPEGEDVLEGAPARLRELAAIGEKIAGATAGIWVGAGGRHRSPEDEAEERGVQYLGMFVEEWDESDEAGELCLALADAALTGGGELPEGVEVSEAARERLAALGLR